jgi:hypothetical protein
MSRRDRDAGRPVERRGPGAGKAWRPNRHQDAPGRTQLEDRLPDLRVGGFVVGVGSPDIPVAIDGEPVWVREQSGAEAPQQPA